MPKVVLSGIDTKPAQSLTLMLESIGYEVSMLSDPAMARYRHKGYTGGVDKGLLDSMGYPSHQIPIVETVEGADIFVDLKIHDLRTMLKIHPEVRGVLYPINGGYDDYEHYGLHFPTITNNFWIQNAYHVYSPMVGDFKPKEQMGTEPPVDLLHNAFNWGFKSYVQEIVDKTGVRVYGSYGSPAGLLNHKDVEKTLINANSFVHIKSSDCPGWALWEAFATATPVVVMGLFIARMKFEDLYIDGETCITWGDCIFEQDKEDPRIIREFMDKMPEAMEELYVKLELLKDPEYNMKIGRQGHELWKKKTEWTEEKKKALVDYLANYKPCA